MPTSPHTLAAALAAATLLVTGCQPAMSNQPRETTTNMGIGHEYPLRFTTHSFSAYCYSTLKCRVDYANVVQVNEDMPSNPHMQGDYQRAWGFGSHIGIDNFPAPARVQWTASNGDVLSADVDVGAIFKDQLVLHRVPRADLPTKTVSHLDGPGVFLEVNDRTLKVFMRQQVYLADTPERTDAMRSDIILAWSKTY